MCCRPSSRSAGRSGFHSARSNSAGGKAKLAFYKIGLADGVQPGLDPIRTIMHGGTRRRQGSRSRRRSPKARRCSGRWTSMRTFQDWSTIPWGSDAGPRGVHGRAVPGWMAAHLVPVTSVLTNLFMTEAELAAETDPDLFPDHCIYHTRGSEFRRDVGRKWVLNETGTYSGVRLRSRAAVRLYHDRLAWRNL